MRNFIYVLLLTFFTSSAINAAIYTVYKDGVAIQYETESALEEGFVGCDSLYVEGLFSGENANRFSNFLSNCNCALSVQVIDLTKAELDSRRSYYFFSACKNTKVFRFPDDDHFALMTDGMFSGFKDLTTIENIDKITIYGFSGFFRNCESLKEVHLKKVKSSDYAKAFKGCKSLEKIYIDTLESERYSSVKDMFEGCENLKEIHLGYADFDYDMCVQLMETDAIIYPYPGESEISHGYSYMYENRVMWHIDSLCAYVVNEKGKLKVLGTTKSPDYMISQDTIWRIGETFESSYVVPSIDSLEEVTDFENKYLWMGMINESMDDYVWSDSILLHDEKYAMAQIIDKKGLKLVDVKDFSDVKISEDASISIWGVLDDSLIVKTKAMIRKAPLLMEIDLSNATFQLREQSLDSLCNVGSVKKIVFPKTKQEGVYDLSNAFRNCRSLETVENLDNISNISSLEYTFAGCKKLKEITFSQEIDTNAISLRSAFEGCDSLKRIENLDRFVKIVNLEYAFNGCKSLQSITFSKEEKHILDLDGVFQNCSSLKTISGLESFSGYREMSYAFWNCSSLDTLRLGAPYRSIAGSSFFGNCNAYVYFPDTITELLIVNVQFFKNAILPIKDVNVRFLSSDSVEILPFPQYIAAQDTIWKYQMDGKILTAKRLTGDILNNSTVIWCGVKNDAMEEYVWSLPLSYQLSQGPYLYVTREHPDSWGGIDGMQVSQVVLIDSLRPGSLYDFCNVYGGARIELHGYCDDSTLVHVKQSMERNSDLTYLKHFDFSDAELDVKDGLKSFFSGASELREVIFSDKPNKSPVSFYNTFSQTLVAHVDLSSFENITSMSHAFSRCYELKDVRFSEKENSNPISFVQAFVGCPLDTLDLSSFSRISDLSQAFFLVTSMERMRFLKFSDKENPLPVSMFQTFSGTEFQTSEIYNFDKFTNITDFRATFQGMDFFSETRLDTVRFGTDPNRLPDSLLALTFAQSGYWVKYLPDGVDTIPSQWRNGHGFVLPIVADTTGWSADSLLNNIYCLPEFGPSYALITDTTWYLVANEFLQTWMESFKFGTSELRSESDNLSPSEDEYMIFNPDSMSIFPFEDKYTLTCVVSNPKFKSLAYSVNLKELIDPNGVENIGNGVNVSVYSEKGGIVVSSVSDSDVDIYDISGRLLYRRKVFEGCETIIPLPSGVYIVSGKGSHGRRVVVR